MVEARQRTTTKSLSWKGKRLSHTCGVLKQYSLDILGLFIRISACLSSSSGSKTVRANQLLHQSASLHFPVNTHRLLTSPFSVWTGRACLSSLGICGNGPFLDNLRTKYFCQGEKICSLTAKRFKCFSLAETTKRHRTQLLTSVSPGQNRI